MQQNPVEQFINVIVGSIASGLGEALAQLAILIFSILAASPAIGSVLFVLMAARWPLLERSPLAAGIGGAVLTALSGFVLGSLIGSIANTVTGLRAVNLVLPYLALIAIVSALWFHYTERATFTTTRAVGIAACIVVPVVLILVNQA